MSKSVDMSSIIDFIKSSKEPVNKKQILEATNYTGDYKYAMKVLKEKYDELKVAGTRSNALYSWSPAKAVYSEMKNPEGYPDSTAGKAIANVMKSDGKYRGNMKQKLGCIYSDAKAKPEVEGLLVLSAKGGTVVGYLVFSEKQPYMKERFTFEWSDDQGTHYILPMCPINIDEQYVGTKPKNKLNPETEERFKKAVRYALDIGIEQVEVPVEVVAEKVVPDPEDKAKLDMLTALLDEVNKKNSDLQAQLDEIAATKDRITDKDLRLAVAEAKLEVYERLTIAWMGKM